MGAVQSSKNSCDGLRNGNLPSVLFFYARATSVELFLRGSAKPELIAKKNFVKWICSIVGLILIASLTGCAAPAPKKPVPARAQQNKTFPTPPNITWAPWGGDSPPSLN